VALVLLSADRGGAHPEVGGVEADEADGEDLLRVLERETAVTTRAGAPKPRSESRVP
jgi:hypothetical protein